MHDDRRHPFDSGAKSASPALLPHVVGLDGLRGLAVAGVLAYHLGVPGFGGGFLGVSLFFTLSGYLITALLLVEHDRTGRIDLRGFWGRRARRLLPAALACLAVVVVVGQGIGGGSGLAGDVQAAVFDVANWRFLLADRSYAELFDGASPVLHYWSLSIEEQCYLVLPLVVWWALRRPGRAGRLRLGAALGLLAVASAGAQVVAGGRFDLVYYGTHTRAAEVLVGGLAALVLPPAVLRRCGARGQRTLAVVGAGGLGALAVLWVTTTLDSGWLAGGGLAVVGVFNAAVVVGAVGRRVGRVLSWRPLIAAGRYSYGLYLYHWPIVVWLDEERTGLSGVALGALRLSLSILFAVASHHLLELRFRLPYRIPAGTARLAAVLTSVTVLVATIGLSGRSVRPAAAALAMFGRTDTPASVVTDDVPPRDAVVLTMADLAAPASSSEAMVPSTLGAGSAAVTVPRRPAVVWLVGDSVAYLLGRSLGGGGVSGQPRWVNLGIPSCDGARGYPRMRLATGMVVEEAPPCGEWERDWAAAAAVDPPDEVLLVLGATTVVDRWMEGRWRSPCDAAFRDWYRPEVEARLAWLLSSTRARVTFVVPAAPDGSARAFVPKDVDDRKSCLDVVYRSIAEGSPAAGRVGISDLGAYVCPPEQGACRPLRADGLHYEGAPALEVAAWLLTTLPGGPGLSGGGRA
jgi:peptidoglycan/LPS O-acetylase OafA/YrhL